MTGRPSAFGKKLIHIICPAVKPLQGCHCARMVFGFWEAQLSAPIKTVLSGQKFNADTYEAVFKLADGAWLANGGATSTPAVVAAVAEKPAPSSPTEPQISAVSSNRGGGRGRGRGGRGNNRGGRGAGRGGNSNSNSSYNNNSNQNQNSSNNDPNAKPHQKGPKHPDLPSNAGWACAQHWKKGRGAPYCSDPLVCQWNQVIAPRNTT